jgi:alcohol dehydrogenase
MSLTEGWLGVDVAVEAVGSPRTFEMCVSLIRPGGAVANVGVHGAPVALDLQDLWIRDVRITTGLVSANTTPMLLSLVAKGRLAPERFITHHFAMDQIIAAYDTFARAAETHAVKVAITRKAA